MHILHNGVGLHANTGSWLTQLTLIPLRPSRTQLATAGRGSQHHFVKLSGPAAPLYLCPFVFEQLVVERKVMSFVAGVSRRGQCSAGVGCTGNTLCTLLCKLYRPLASLQVSLSTVLHCVTPFTAGHFNKTMSGKSQKGGLGGRTLVAWKEIERFILFFFVFIIRVSFLSATGRPETLKVLRPVFKTIAFSTFQCLTVIATKPAALPLHNHCYLFDCRCLFPLCQTNTAISANYHKLHFYVAGMWPGAVGHECYC